MNCGWSFSSGSGPLGQSASKTETFTATGNGATQNVNGLGIKSFALQVTGTGATPTSWDVRLEGSLNGTVWTQILQHTNVTGDGVTVFSGAPLSPVKFMRSRVAGLVLGGATNIVVETLGVN